jgi:hypothetical protein
MLARELGRIVGGGQVDGAKNQVRHIPLPDLAELYLETPELKEQAEALRTLDQTQYPKPLELDAFAAAAFRTHLSAWKVLE